MRLLDNCSLDADKVRGIMDDLDYYVDSNQVDCIQWCQIRCAASCWESLSCVKDFISSVLGLCQSFISCARIAFKLCLFPRSLISPRMR